RQDADFADKHLGGLYRIDYSLQAADIGGIQDPVFLQQVQAFDEWWKAQPETIHVNSFTDIMTRLNKNMHGDDPAWHRLPQSRELAAQYLLLYEMSLPYGLDLNNQINVDKSATRMSVSIKTVSTKEVLALEQRASDWLQTNAPAIISGEGTSPTVMFSHIGDRNIKSMLGGATLALVLISLILIVAMRSWKIGLISMIPNLLPAGMGFGIWALMNGEIGLGLSVVVSMTLGIVVDDTIHFLSKYLRARREHNYDSIQAVRYAFSRVGTALWVTSVVLITGFLVLSLSSFQLNAHMGLLTALVIALALAADFLLLPALLMKLEEKSYANTLSTGAAVSESARP
ncbi:MAG: MMPL family transporter, partial [Gammaproteobacteria bacterium]|nr:MMPL family transporter [Gammaproteobacteria bacterium]